jgi:hypothetical protein
MAKSILDAYDTDETKTPSAGSAILDAYDTGDTGASQAPVKGGILPNLGKGALQGTAGTINTVTDPAQTLVYNPLAVGASYVAPWVAQHVFGMSPDRADKLAREIRGEGDQATVFGPPAGTAAIHGIGTLVGKQPEDVPTGTTAERIAGETARGAVNPLMPGSLVAATARNVGASIGGGELANVAPDWLKPGAELVGNAVGGYVEPGINLLARPFTGSGPPSVGPPPSLAGVKPPEPSTVARAGAQAGETTPVPPAKLPTTPEEATAIANTHYTNARQAGANITAPITNSWIDKAKGLLTSTEEGEALGPDHATELRDKLDALRDKPLSLEAVQDIDERMTTRETAALKAGDNKSAARIADAKYSLREMIDGADENDIEGGKTGFDALADGRKAWQQSRKMTDVQAMWDRSQGTANPERAFATRVNTFKNNPRAKRGWSDDEITTLEDAASQGKIMNVMRFLGGRLMPYVGLATHGPLGAAAATAVNEAARAGMSKMQASRYNQTMRVLGSSVPLPKGVPNLAPWNPNAMLPTPWSFQSLPDITSQQPNPLTPPS